jgi:hypothetical protein
MSNIIIDIVIWDSHPLALGAAPQQVYIDGISQLKNPHVTTKPTHAQKAPHTPDFDKEASLALEYDGLPPLEFDSKVDEPVLFTNVNQVHLRGRHGQISRIYSLEETGSKGVVLVNGGKLVCVDSYHNCGQDIRAFNGVKTINLRGGSIAYVVSFFIYYIISFTYNLCEAPHLLASEALWPWKTLKKNHLPKTAKSSIHSSLMCQKLSVETAALSVPLTDSNFHPVMRCKIAKHFISADL